jgi:HK97 gp10 family phage protein
MIAQLNKKQVADLKRMLVVVPKKIRNKILRKELRAAAKALIAPSKSATPVKTGTLRKSVKARSARSRKAVAMRVGFSDKAFTGDTFYGSFLEWGWQVGKRPSKTIAGTEKDTRTQVKPRFILKRVAERLGPALMEKALQNIRRLIALEARNA